MVETLLAIGNAASWWREQAESMERQRNEAHAEIMKMQAENEQLRLSLARPPVAQGDDVLSAARRLLTEIDVLAKSAYTRTGHSLTDFETDMISVARAVLVAGERESKLRAALEEVHRYALSVVGASEAYGETESAHLWNEVAVIAETALWPLAASGTAPEATTTASTRTCDACGLPITEDYVEAVSEGVEGEYHMACVPPGLPMRTVLIS